MGNNYHQKLIIACLLLLCSCMKDKPPSEKVTIPNSNTNVYIICQGNYQDYDATLYDYVPTKDSVYGDLYQAINNQKLGDVFQSMCGTGNYFFLVVNNSNKIVVVDKMTLKTIATINMNQPRYMLQVSASKAYVSSIKSNKIYVIDPQQFTITDTIYMPTQSAEQMCLYNGNVIACSWDTAANHIYEIDGNTDKIIQSYTIPGYAPQAALLDKDQMLWIMAGDQSEGKTATLTRMDPSTGVILKSFAFNNTTDALNPVFNQTLDTLYFIEANYYAGTANNGIYRMSIYDYQLPAQPFAIPVYGDYFYGLGIDPLTGNIYVADPHNFQGSGEAYIYLANGKSIDSFKTGRGPGGFYFDN